jgi:Do/DeqQ family serine protease
MAIAFSVMPSVTLAGFFDKPAPKEVINAMPSLAPMIEEASPSVVRITVKGQHKVKQQLPRGFEQFFQRRGQSNQQQPFQALGSGVIINEQEGYIVTNAHVVNEADEITVILSDGRQFKAKEIGADSEADIALLQIKAENIKAIAIADSDQLRVGDYTVAIGNPFGLNQTVTSGIVSALGRSDLNIEAYEDFIQTDAAINSGNSGGALINLRGELIGINTAILGPNGGNIGIGFAIPSNMMQNLVNQLIEFGEVKRGILGISGSNLTADLAQSFDLTSKHGVFINEVMSDSAASKAGIQAGDIITRLNGRPIRSINELRGKVGPIGVGKKIELVIVRDGNEKEFTVLLQENDVATLSAQIIHPMLEGAKFSNSEQGIKITSIEKNSPAMRLGLKENDIIMGVNRQKTKNVKSLRESMKYIEGSFALNILRGNSSLYLILR